MKFLKLLKIFIKYNPLYIFFSLIFFFFILLLRPIFKVKIGEIESRAIGHFSLPIEIFLCELKKNIFKKKNNEIFLFFYNKKISNTFLLEKYKKKLIFFPRIILEPIFKFLIYFEFGQIFLVPFRHWSNTKYWQIKDVHNVLENTDPQIQFTEYEITKGENNLKKVDIQKADKIFGFMSRSNHYRNDEPSTRDSSIYELLDGIKYISNKYNYKAIRFGLNPDDRVEGRNIIDYSNTEIQNDFNDIFFISKCDFFISTGSGINCVATMFRKPKLMVNYVDYFSIINQCEKYCPFILPKKFQYKKNNKIVPLSEIFKKKIYQVTSHKELSENGYLILENTSLEILDAVKEFTDLQLENKKQSKYQFEQNEFWKLYKKYFDYSPKNLRISQSFFYEKVF